MKKVKCLWAKLLVKLGLKKLPPRRTRTVGTKKTPAKSAVVKKGKK